jgi:hypothetical protein
MSDSFHTLLESYHREIEDERTRWYYRKGRLTSSMVDYYALGLRTAHRRTAMAILTLPPRVMCRDVRVMLARAVIEAGRRLVWTPPVPQLVIPVQWGDRSTFDMAVEHAESRPDARILVVLAYVTGLWVFFPPEHREKLVMTGDPRRLVASGACVPGITMLCIENATAQAGTPGLMLLIRTLSEAGPFIFLMQTQSPESEIKFQ